MSDPVWRNVLELEHHAIMSANLVRKAFANGELEGKPSVTLDALNRLELMAQEFLGYARNFHKKHGI